MRRLLAARGTPAAMIGILLLLFVGGGYALANSSGAITACVHARTHVLYTGKCRKHDKKLTWNLRGPQGSRGIPGPRGVEGPMGGAGATGPSNAYSVHTPGSFFLTSSNMTVASLTVPAGAYLAFARVIPLQDSSSTQYIQCELIGPTGSQADSDFETLATNTTAPLTLQGPISTTAGGKITAQCYKIASSGVIVQGATLAAIKLDSVTGT